MLFEPVTPDDLETVTAQLGRRPKDVVGIAARCPAGHPCVVVNHPIRRQGERLVPFPTLFWLTCPELIKSVARLEMRGTIAELDARLESDDGLAADLERNHASYIEQRWALLSDDDRREVEKAGLRSVFAERGIGGLGHFRSVKCLHAHLAHELADANVIGALLRAEHGVCPCA